MFEKQIQAGAKFLDEKMPGWMNKINLDNLMMSHGCSCILGQIFGDYQSAIGILMLSRTTSVDLGFTTYSQFTQLTEEWKEFMNNRLGLSSNKVLENLMKLREGATITIMQYENGVDGIAIVAPWTNGTATFTAPTLAEAIEDAVEEKEIAQTAKPFDDIDYKEIFAVRRQNGMENYLKIDDKTYISLEDKNDPIQHLERGNAVETKNQRVYPPTIKLTNV